ncbi:MAG: hypothetical protein ACYSU8_11730 [Planctomycetota bacterium]|jgi:hypothetical protein
MSVFKKTLVLACCVSLLSGCYEDRTEITLKADGSGTIKQKLVISERLIVATSENGGDKNTPPVSKEEMLEKVGSAIDITSFTLSEMPDGGRAIEFEGTFSSVEQFFLSEFCRDTLKLRIAPGESGKAIIYCDTEESNSGGPSITQLYGLAKGLYVTRTVHLTGEIEKTNGNRGNDKNTVSWVTDLRNKEGLTRTKAFVEGKDKGVGSAVFDASALEFSLPLKAVTSTEEKETDKEKPEKPQKESTGLAAKVSWVSLKKKMKTDGAGTTEVSDPEIGIELSWNEGRCPIRCEKPVLLSISDNQNKDLLSDKGPFVFQGKIFPNEEKNKRKELTLRAKTPSENAQALKHIEGYIPVVTNTHEEKVILENIQKLAGKEATDNPVLDKLHFKIKSVEGSRLEIEIDGGHDTIVSLEIYKEDGSEVEHRGSSGWGNSYSYDFANDISKLNKCELEVIVSQTIVKVPFSLKEITLP